MITKPFARSPMQRFVALIAIALGLFAASGRAAESPEELSKRLSRVFLDFSAASRALFPLAATANGWRAYDDQFTVYISDEHREKQREWCRTHRAAASDFDRDALNENDRLSHDIFLYNLEGCLARLDHDLHLFPIDQSGWGLPATFPIFGSGRGAHPFRNVRDYENFLKRVPGFVAWMDTAIANMRRGMERGWTQPRPVMQSALKQLDALIVADPAQSPFYQPIVNIPPAIGGDDRERLARQYEAAIRDQIVPAYRRVRDFVRDEYLSKSRASVGLGALKGGDRLYAHSIKTTTTLSLTPDEIFDLGQRELSIAWLGIEELKRASGFQGDVREWASRLRQESARYKSAEEAVAAYRAMHGEVYAQLGRYFGRLPKREYEIRPVESYREAGSASQYWGGIAGRPAIFYVNLRALNKEPVTASLPLFLHEVFPGHHLQISIARENTALPNFRRGSNFPAFSEGWARYAELLGVEMGLYRDTYQNLVWLNSELWSAAGLVADVGIHAKGWTREQALRFFAESTLSPYLGQDFETGNVSQVERIISQPGYALAYRIGQLKMSELRARAERVLGPSFDLRAFHDELLKDGAMPLGILDAKMDRWMAREAATSRH